MKKKKKSKKERRRRIEDKDEEEELRDYVRGGKELVWEERLLKSSASAREHREDSEPVARSDVSELSLQAGR